MIYRPHPTLAGALCLALVAPASGFHRETPPVTAITTSGDTDLPRVPSQGRRSLALEQGPEIATYLPFATGAQQTVVAASGADPAVSFSGRTFAWGTDGAIVLAQDGTVVATIGDPSGTSANPSLDKRGQMLAFESQGDLTDTGTPGVSRVYLRSQDGALTLASMGAGSSDKPMLSAKGGLLTFESTSDPVTGLDTGIRQVWAGRMADLPVERITGGAGPSTDPIVSDDGRLISFCSSADLSGDGVDTGVAQVFVYDSQTRTAAQLTSEPAGCSRPAVAKIRQDWRITFVCDGQAYYHMLRENQRYHVPMPDGLVQAIVPEMGVHFLTVSTTADLLAGSGTTAGYQIYILNLFRRPAVAVTGGAAWFPSQGIPGF